MFTPFNNILVLDALKDASCSAAYSLRKLKANATKAIKVRRSNDDATLDIGFSGINLDVSSLLSFVGSNSGYVDTWYDQSGNNNHATQSTKANQPRIVDSGVVDVDSGKPCIQTILNDDTHFVVPDANSLDFTTNVSISVVHNPNSAGENNGGRIVDKGTGVILNISTSGLLSLQGTISNVLCYTTSTTNINTIIADSSLNQTIFYLNGNLNKTTTRNAFSVNSDNLLILNRIDKVRQYDGKISELIMLKTSLNDIQRQKLERNQGKYFSVTVT